MNAGIAAFRAGGAPHILQVFEVGTATMMSAKGAIKPVYELMQETGEPFDPKSFLTAVTGYYSTAKGEMLSFPFNSSTEVMWVNLDALKKAGVDKVPATWPEAFDAATKLHNAGYEKCGISTAWITWTNIEQFNAWHNLQLSTKANGLDGFDTVLTFNKNPAVVRHFENLARYQKDKTFDYSGLHQQRGEGRFTSGECPLFITSSAFLGTVKAAAQVQLHERVHALLSGRAGRAAEASIIGGASLVGPWAARARKNTRASPSSSPISPGPRCRRGGTSRPATCRSPTRPMSSPRRRATTTRTRRPRSASSR